MGVLDARRVLVVSAAVALLAGGAVHAEPSLRHGGRAVEVRRVPLDDDDGSEAVQLAFTGPGRARRVVDWITFAGCDELQVKREDDGDLGDRRLAVFLATCDHGADFFERQVEVALVFVGDRRRRGRVLATATGHFGNERDACLTIDVPFFRRRGRALEQVRWREVAREEANHPGADCVAAPRRDTVERALRWR